MLVSVPFLLNRILYEKVVGVVALKRSDKSTIVTTVSLVPLIRYIIKGVNRKKEFEKDCEKFFNSLEKGIYYTKTHAKFKRYIESNCGKENTLSVEIERKNMFVEKLVVGNPEKLLKKHSYYKVAFKIN